MKQRYRTVPRILYIQYTNPAGYPPLQHSSQMLAASGWQVLFFGTGPVGGANFEFPAHGNVTVRSVPFREAGWAQKLHYATFCARAIWISLLWRPKWIYASDPFSCLPALIMSAVPGRPIIYHEHDTPSPGTPRNRFQKIVDYARRALARRAAVCILPNEERMERFQNEMGQLRSSICVWNCPSVSEARKSPRESSDLQFRLLYHGSIVPERLPLTVIDALALLPSTVTLRIVGYETAGARNHVEEIVRRAKSLDLQERVEFLGTIPQRADMLRIAGTSDIGFALMPKSPADWNCATMTGASNKAFDYLAYGLPLIVSDLPDWRRMFIEPGYAVGCDPEDAASLAAAVRTLIANPDRMRAIGEAGRQRILTAWNYETVFAPVLERILNACA